MENCLRENPTKKKMIAENTMNIGYLLSRDSLRDTLRHGDLKYVLN